MEVSQCKSICKSVCKSMSIGNIFTLNKSQSYNVTMVFLKTNKVNPKMMLPIQTVGFSISKKKFIFILLCFSLASLIYINTI